MIENKEKLAKIQRDLIEPALKKDDNVDIIIKIRNGGIVWAESLSSQRVRVDFKEIFIV